LITVAEARRLYDAKDAAHDFDHVLRVMALAERIAIEEGANLQVVRAAALLHDLEHNAGKHHLRGADRAREILQDHPVLLVNDVAHAIAAHRYRAKPDPLTLEAKVLYDADKLDAIGAIGVARVFAHGAFLGNRLFSPLDQIDPTSPPSGPDYTPVHEYCSKLTRLKDLLYTKSAREIARGRHEFMVSFFQQLDAELTGTA